MTRAVRAARRPRRGVDRGAVDVSVQMLFGSMAFLLVLLLIFETTAYWHARNVFDDAAAEGARVAAAHDGTCAMGVAATHRMIAAHAGRWGQGASVRCTGRDVITVVVSGPTPGVAAPALGMRASVRAVTPRER